MERTYVFLMGMCSFASRQRGHLFLGIFENAKYVHVFEQEIFLVERIRSTEH